MAQLLLQEGYRVETARGGREALRILRTVHPCIILLDLMMPDMSGYDFRQAQLADDDLKDIPVVIYSAAYDIVEQTKQLGAAGFAQKPIEIGRLHILGPKASQIAVTQVIRQDEQDVG